jgi:hypothetical protein
MTSGTRRVEVAAERVPRWLENFASRHGEPAYEPGPERVTVTAPDGTGAVLHVPFPPLDVDPDAADGGLAAHVARDRRVGVLLVRLGGYAAGVFEGTRLVSSKVGSRHVQGRTAAGGQSQQRFARRRREQARAAYAAAADVAARVLVPEADRLDALVTGGDRTAVAAVLEDPRLAPLRDRVSGGLLDVPDPRQKVLEDAPRRFRAVVVDVTDP